MNETVHQRPAGKGCCCLIRLLQITSARGEQAERPLLSSDELNVVGEHEIGVEHHGEVAGVVGGELHVRDAHFQVSIFRVLAFAGSSSVQRVR